MEMVGLGELAGADRKGRSMIYTPMTNSQGERVGSVRFAHDITTKGYAHTFRAATTLRFPSAFRGNSLRFPRRNCFLTIAKDRLYRFDSRRWKRCVVESIAREFGNFGIEFFRAREEEGVSQACDSITHICLVEINGQVHAKLRKESSSKVRRPFFRPGTSSRGLSLSLSLSFATLCHLHPPSIDIFRRKKCF